MIDMDAVRRAIWASSSERERNTVANMSDWNILRDALVALCMNLMLGATWPVREPLHLLASWIRRRRLAKLDALIAQEKAAKVKPTPTAMKEV